MAPLLWKIFTGKTCSLKSMLNLIFNLPWEQEGLRTLPSLSGQEQEKGPSALLDLYKTKNSINADGSAEFNQLRNIKFDGIKPAEQKGSFIKDNAYVLNYR